MKQIFLTGLLLFILLNLVFLAVVGFHGSFKDNFELEKDLHNKMKQDVQEELLDYVEPTFAMVKTV